jgi:hypothetical protein
MQPTTYELYSYKDVAPNRQMLNLKQIDYFLFFKIPDEMAATYNLFDISEFSNYDYSVIDYQEYVEREGKTPWLKVQSSMLNKQEGYHCFKFHFVNINTNDIVCLYFAYTAQNDNPAKPYLHNYRRNLSPEVEREFLNMDDGERYERKL